MSGISEGLILKLTDLSSELIMGIEWTNEFNDTETCPVVVPQDTASIQPLQTSDRKAP